MRACAWVRARTQVKAMRIGTISLYTKGLSDAEQALTAVHMVDDVQEYIRACVAKHRDTAVAFIPEGPYVVPVC